MVREATHADIPAINAIENDAICTTYAHFGLEPLPIESTREAFEATSDAYPWLVMEIESTVVAFARASPWKSRGAYRWTTEIGVYVLPTFQGRGVGIALYEGLFALLERKGFHTVVAGIALPNEPSIKLHERFGMVHAGTLPEMGFKLDRWRSVGYWVRVLGNGPKGA